MNRLFLISFGIFLLAGVLSLAGNGSRAPLNRWVQALLSIAAAIIGLIPAVSVLAGGEPLDIQRAWGLPAGSFHLRMDVLSAWFAVPVLFISGLAAVYGTGYMQPQESRKGYGFNGFAYQLLVAGMLLTITAWDGVLFLIAWEIMSIAAWFLVMFEHEKAAVRQAGWIYLTATHLGTAFLFALFVILKDGSGSFDFSAVSGTAISANLVFFLALVGFGAKAGFFGLHVWLPEAHPAAPSHVSALMSGVMIKTGIYGLIRILTFFPAWPEWWGWVLVAAGIASGLGGILHATVQKDLKRLLAFSSVENIGIIAMGLGIGMICIHREYALAVPAIAGAMLHVWNHAIFKSALFMGAGSVLHATGTRSIDRLGGLGKRMPTTSLVFLVAAAAVCGLPPFNGFVGELLIYIAAFGGISMGSGSTAGPVLSGFIVAAALALVGGLAAICFTKVFGIVFLGEPRQAYPGHVHEGGWRMTGPMIILAGTCVVIGMGGFLLVDRMGALVAAVSPRGVSGVAPAALLGEFSSVLFNVAMISAVLLALGFILFSGRKKLLAGRVVAAAPTWGCGYTRPTTRMQYTGTSFVQPLVAALGFLLPGKQEGMPVAGYFPAESTVLTRTDDPFMSRVYGPLFNAVAAGFSRFRRIQHGRLHLYLLHIIITLVAIICWSFL